MRVLGIDLSAQPSTTGVIVLHPVADGRWQAIAPLAVATDRFLTDLGAEVDIVGLDAPLGWPDDFVEAVSLHHQLGRWPGSDDRRALTHRLTDDVVRDSGWGHPLSASADKLGSTAMRAAVLQRDWADRWGAPAPRDGSGRLVEVYPAAALRSWGLYQRGYKGGSSVTKEVETAARHRIFADIRSATGGWLDLAEVAAGCRSSHDQLDALVSALAALAARRGVTQRPDDEEQRRRAFREGWIHVPTGSLAEL